MQEWILEITFVEQGVLKKEDVIVIKATDVFGALFHSCREVNFSSKKHPNARIERVDLTLFSE